MLTFIAERAKEDATALVRPGGESMSYGTLAMASAAVMQALGERVGDVARRIVGVAVEEGAGFVASVLAVLEAGAVVLPLDPRRGLFALEREAAAVRALAVIIGDAADDRLDVVAVDASRRELPAEACALLDAGGRRALYSRAALGIGVDAVVQQVGLDATARVPVLGAPAATSTLIGTVLPTLRAGGTLLLVNALPAAEQARAMVALGGNVVTGTMPELAALTADAAGLPARRVVAVGAPDDAALASLAGAFPTASLGRAFDTGEALRIAAAERDADWTALPGVELAFVDAATAEVAAPTAMLGYLDDADATRAAFVERDGRRLVRARDVGFVDAALLERIIAAAPGVREAAVVAARDARGERLYAFVSGDSAAAPQHPARLVTLESLPHRSDGSVDREALRRMVSTD